MLRIAYISPTYFSNVDIPYIHELRKHCDIYYFAVVPASGRGYAINITNLPNKAGIYSATDFKELELFRDIVNLQNTFIVYRKAKHSWSASNFRVTHELCMLLKQENFDIIHTSDPYRYYEWELLQFKNKSICSVHDPFLHSSMDNILARIYRKISFAFMQKLIIFNHNQEDDFKKTHHLDDDKVYCSSLSAYTYLQLYDHSTMPSQNKPYALYFGNIQGYKGLEYLFEAMPIVHEKHPEFHFVIAGKGKYYFDISKYINCPYITIINRFIPDEQIVPIIVNCDFLVCPYTDATQSGVIMSAYAFDKPCLVTRTGGLPEMVGDGDYGIIIPPRNSKDLADAMCKMIEQPEILHNFSQKIHREYHDGRKSWKHIADDLYENVYTDIANRNNNKKS